MYFNTNDLVNISSIIKNDELFYAHKKENEKETLINHIDLCNKYFLKIFDAKKLDKIFANFEINYLNELDEKGILLFRKLLLNVVNFHDIGKVNPLFQSVKMDNIIKNKNNIKDNNEISSKHSLLSSVIYIDKFLGEVNYYRRLNKKQYDLLLQILVLNSYVISRHHGNLSEFSDFYELFNPEDPKDGIKTIEFINKNYEFLFNKEFDINKVFIYKKIKNVSRNLIKNQKDKSIFIYTYIKLVYSLLVASDFYATNEFMNNVETKSFGNIENIDEFYKVYKESEIYKSIRDYENISYNKEKDLTKEQDINVLRSEMFLDSEKELIKNIKNNIFFLEAPTGSGKSNTAINLSFKIFEEDKNIKKIYYVYPFNTLIEQNINSFEKMFTKDVLSKVSVINSVSPIKIEKDLLNLEEKEDMGDFNYYSKAFLDRQFLNYPIILTTHVSLFDTLFGSTKEKCFAFHQLSNSVIVLDEIQSYKNTIWTEIITFLYNISKILNIKIIIMSATLPNLSFLLDNSNDLSVVNLINDREKYFSNSLFKDRVVVNYDLIDKDIDDLFNSIKENSKNKKILVEFIKKQSAYDFYDRLKEEDLEVELLTGDDNIVERQRILDKINTLDEIILVSTQVIEAGVDIDMDIGYKDISKLDSEEQFMGRINRSCKKSGLVYFFNIDNGSLIYKNDLRINKKFTLENDDIKEILVNKNFSSYYEEIMKSLKDNFNNRLSDCNLDKFFLDNVCKLDFNNIEKRMKLIEDDNYKMSIYLSRKIKLANDELLDGNEIWEEYKKLLKDNSLSYSEKEFKLFNIRTKLNYFIYQTPKTSISFNYRIGEIYFIEDGENYFKDNKVDKEKIITGDWGFFSI